MDTRPQRSVRGLGTALTLLLGGQVVLDLLSIAGLTARIAMLNRFIGGGFVSQEEAQMADSRVVAPAIAGLVVFVITLIVWLVWQHHAQDNLVRRGVAGLRFTPGWAVGWWFVPFANLVKPYQTMRELRLASADPEGWREAKGPPVLMLWWLTWIVGNLLASAAFQMSRDATTAQAVKDADLFGVFLSVLSLAAAVLAITIVRSITTALERLRTAVPPPPPPPGDAWVSSLPPRPDPSAG